MIFDRLKLKRNHETSEPENARKKGRRILSLLQREKQEPTREITDNNAEIQKRKEFITDHVDISALFDSIFAVQENERSKYIGALKSINGILSLSKNDINTATILRDFSSTVEILESEDLISKEKIEAPLLEESLENITDEAENWMNDTAKAVGLISTARENHIIPQLNAFKDTMDFLQPTLQLLGKYDSNTRKHMLHPLVTGAFQQSLRHHKEYIDKSDEIFINKEEEARPNGLYLGGLNHLKEPLNLTEPREWVNRRLALFPQWMQKGLGTITFQPQLVALQGHHKAEGFEEGGAGGMLPSANKIIISTQLDRYQKFTKEVGTEKVHYVHEHLRTHVGHTLTHEVAHYIHNQRLPLKELRKWIKVTQKEQTHISEYAEARKDHQHSLQEDFAESITFYHTKPRELIEAQPQKFLLIQEWFKNYPSSAVETFFNPYASADEKRQSKALLTSGGLVELKFMQEAQQKENSLNS